MKTQSLLTLGLILLHSVLGLSVRAQTTAFTYQGRLTENGAVASGTNDFTFTLYDAVSGGATVGAGNVVNDLAVTNGLFTTALDFGAAAFSGSDRWLEIGVRPGTNAGAYTPLTPRQRITAAPYAIRAANLTGALPLSQLPAGVVTNNSSGVLLSGTFTGQGASLSNVNASTLGGLSSAGFWKTNGNAGANPTNGAFLGTTDNLPVEFRVNGARALRLEPNANGAPNVIGGSPSNRVTVPVEGATIAGGGLGLYPNTITASYATIGGGTFNTAAGGWATIGGGRDINVTGGHATVSGGSLNTIQTAADFATIGGGVQNMILSNAFTATIGGGANNTVRSNAYRGTVGGGAANTVGAAEGTVAGGAFNSALGFSSVIGGGGGNAVSGEWSVIAGGRDNVLTNAPYATIGGGVQNTIQTNAAYATIGGGVVNVIQINAFNSTLGGGRFNTIQNGSGDATLNGGFQNTIQSNAFATTIGGGANNTIRSNSWNATVGGGVVNTVGASEGTVAGGAYNSALGFSSTVGGGGGNTAGGDWSTIAGGRDNVLTNAAYSTIGGGLQNMIQPNAFAATIPGGLLNSATHYGFAAGRRAKANHEGAFVWADATDADFPSTGTNQFLIRASGGVGINNNNPNGAALAVNGFVTVEGVIYANALSAASTTTPEVITPRISTSGNVPLNFYANNQRALRLEPTAYPDTVNVIGGSALNFAGAGVVGATISGGGGSDLFAFPSSNSVEANFGTVSGGAGNTIQSNARFASIGGGVQNLIQAGAAQSTIGGGFLNTIQTSAHNATLGGGVRNEIQFGANAATLGGGYQNTIQTNADYATIAGGFLNKILTNAERATIGGGDQNTAGGNYATVPGGVGNTAGGQFSFAAGHDARALHEGAFVWSDAPGGGFSSTSSNQFLIRASGGVGINKNNPATALDVNGTVTATSFSGSGATLTGLNAASLTGTIADTRLSGNVALRGGGNAFTGNQTIAGAVGIGTASPQAALHVYSAGSPTTIRVQSAGGFGAGRIEFLSDPQGTGNEWRPGYIQSTDNGSFTGGLSFVVNGTGFGNFFTEVETMRIMNGRVGIGTNNPQSALHVVGTVTATAFNPSSDRNLKENFAPVSPREVLDKVTALPISRWNFKGDGTTPHVGPMAQDFHAAFGLGTDERHIATVDADGVALAAIQGLNEKVENGRQNSEGRMQKLESENAELKQELAEIKRLLVKLSRNEN